MPIVLWQASALMLLWLQNLISKQLSWLVLIVIPLSVVLIAICRPISKPWILFTTVIILVLWALNLPLSDRSAWLTNLANLLWLMTALKLLESKSLRSHQRCSLLLLLDVALAGAMDPSLIANVLQGLGALIAIGTLVALEGGTAPIKGLFKRSLFLLALALPMVFMSFLLLPRLPALWSLPSSTIARSGLSNSVRPGAVDSLMLDNSLVARIHFATNQPPPSHQRYWRTLVLNHFDGSGWDQGNNEPGKPLPKKIKGPIQQTWLVEANQLQWLPWGGAGVPRNQDVNLTADGTLWTATPMQDRRRIEVLDTSLRPTWLDRAPLAIDQQYPTHSNPKLESLGKAWGATNASPLETVELARRWFQDTHLQYSLEPGQLPQKAPLDTFLFDQKKGFCEHFAASFSALMRAAGLPARVVVGYQGGNWEQHNGGTPYLSITNRDAHAWSEVWIEGQGWTAVDPTAWVSSADDRSKLLKRFRAHGQGFPRGNLGLWIQNIGSEWQDIDTQWQFWVAQFDHQKQEILIAGWLQGHTEWQPLIALAAIGTTLAITATFLQLLNRRYQQEDRLRRSLDTTLKKLKLLGIEAMPGENLEDICRRTSQAFPQFRHDLSQLNHAYTRLRFDQLNASERRQVIHEWCSIRERLKWVILVQSFRRKKSTF